MNNGNSEQKPAPPTDQSKEMPKGCAFVLIIGGLIFFIFGIVGLFSIIREPQFVRQQEVMGLALPLIVAGAGSFFLYVGMAGITGRFDLVSPEWNAEISLLAVSTPERQGALNGAASDALTRLQVRFPEAEGYQYKVVTKTQPMIYSNIRVRRGLTWGMHAVYEATDKDLTSTLKHKSAVS